MLLKKPFNHRSRNAPKSKWLEKTFLFSRHYFLLILSLCSKGRFSYLLCYSVDKKGYRKEKNILKMVGGLKECSNFAGEKKGTLKLVILISRSILYYSTDHKLLFITIIHINMYPRAFHNRLCFNIYFFSFLPRIVKR